VRSIGAGYVAQGRDFDGEGGHWRKGADGIDHGLSVKIYISVRDSSDGTVLSFHLVVWMGDTMVDI